MTEQRYFFVHMQKTGGTSLYTMLRQHLGAQAVYPRPDDGPAVSRVIDNVLLRERLGESDEIRVVTGHFPLSTVELLPGRWRTFTVLREPVERTLSFLRHQQKVDPARATQSLEEIYEDPVLFNGLVKNHMVKMLSLPVEGLPQAGVLADVELGEPDLNRAVANLKGIDVVGVQIQLESFVDRLNETFGWSLGPVLVTNTTDPQEPALGLRERIAADSHLDVRLYASAMELA